MKIGFVSHHCVASFAAVLTVSAGFVGSAHAQPAPDVAEPGRDQLDADIEPLPAEYGAIFVPAVEALGSVGDANVVVLFEGETLKVGSIGQRIAVPPGSYRILIGSGPEAGRAATEVVVVRGQTTMVKPSYGVVRISIVDRQGKPAEGQYVVGSYDNGQKYGPYWQNLEPGQRASRALYLAPGRYTFALGSNPTAQTDAAAFLIGAGEVLHYRVVVEDDHIVRTEFGEADPVEKPSIWKVRLTLAADASFSSARAQLSSYNGEVLTVGGLAKFGLALDTGRHLAELNLSADENVVGVRSVGSAVEFPLQKLTDDVRAELLYNYRLGGVIGPYARALGYTSLFPTRFYAGNNANATTIDEAGNVLRTETLRAGENYRLFPEFAPIIAQEGAGLGSKFDIGPFRLTLRAGVAARQAAFFDGRYAVSQTNTDVRFKQLNNITAFGAEATAELGFTMRNLLDVSSRLDGFLGDDQFDTVFEGNGNYRPVFRWDNTASLRLGRYVALAYVFGVRRDSPAIPQLQSMHSLRLRFQWSVF